MIKHLPLVLGLIIYSTSYSQFNFEKNTIIDETHGTQRVSSVISIDIDGDGDLDAVCASRFEWEITWYENLDDSDDFYPRGILSQIYGHTDVYGGDIDGDGDIDILSSAKDDNTIMWFENLDGKGQFSDPIIVSTGFSNGPREVENIFLYDLDNDDHLDILATLKYGERIIWYKNIDGKGTYSDAMIIDSGLGYPHFIKVSDIDGDEDLDIVFSSWDYKTIWYENEDGMGNFSPKKTINEISDFNLEVADVDGDGDTDIISSTTSNIVWQENIDGEGNFGEIQVIGQNYDYIESINTGDFDGDGDLDLTFLSYYDEKMIWFKNLDGNGNFSDEIIIQDEIIRPVSVIFDDMDEDGDLDILAGAYFEGVYWYENLDSSGELGPLQQISKNAEFTANSVYSGDLDGDGDLDLVSSSSNFIGWYENRDGKGDFSTQRIITRDGTSGGEIHQNGGGALSIGDVDNDGDLDIIIISKPYNTTFSPTIKLFRNADGLGTFSEAEELINGDVSMTFIKLIDLDADEDLDIAFSTNRGMKWLKNIDGNGNFTPAIIAGADELMIGLGDLDGDTYIDAVGSSLKFWYKNTLEGFTSNGQVLNSIPNNTLLIVDLNNDNSNDILSGNRWYSKLENSNDFDLAGIIDNGGQNHTQVGDFDNDGDLDIVSSSQSTEYIFINENLDGLGNFGEKTTLDSESNEPRFMHIADIDGDGDLDVVSISPYTINWYRNTLILNNNKIQGAIRMDQNLNGCDIDDLRLNRTMIISESTDKSFAVFSDETGNYDIFIDDGTYITTASSNLPEYFTINPESVERSFDGYGNTEQIDFCIVPSAEVNDAQIAIYPTINRPRPGFSTTYTIVYKNLGSTLINGNINFEFDESKLILTEASESFTMLDSNLLNFNVQNLMPFRSGSITLYFDIITPPEVNIDDILVTSAEFNLEVVDNIPENNNFVLEQSVVGSYDPNDISVLEGDKIFIDDSQNYLHYLIRFQNTGNAEAINITVENVLDDKFEWETLEIESLSHDGKVSIEDGKMVKFIFNDINLPDSTSNEAKSHGYIAYRIKPKSNVIVGDRFLNNADIYFDFNPPIYTNTVSTEIVSTLSNDEYLLEELIVYPNPTNTQVNIVSEFSIEKIECYNYLGQLVSSNKLKSSIDLSNLNNGLYFLMIFDDVGRNKVIKIIKN